MSTNSQKAPASATAPLTSARSLGGRLPTADVFHERAERRAATGLDLRERCLQCRLHAASNERIAISPPSIDAIPSRVPSVRVRSQVSGVRTAHQGVGAATALTFRLPPRKAGLVFTTVAAHETRTL